MVSRSQRTTKQGSTEPEKTEKPKITKFRIVNKKKFHINETPETREEGMWQRANESQKERKEQRFVGNTYKEMITTKPIMRLQIIMIVETHPLKR